MPYHLKFDGMNIHYGNTNILTSPSLSTEIDGISNVAGVVGFPTNLALGGSWVLRFASFNTNTNQFVTLAFHYLDQVGWQYDSNSTLSCPKIENEFPSLGLQTMQILDGQGPLTLWYDERNSYDTTPGAPCDAAINTIRTSSGIISVYSTPPTYQIPQWINGVCTCDCP